jgi:hypothetical protein
MATDATSHVHNGMYKANDAPGRGPYLTNPGTYKRTGNSSRRRMTNTSTCTAQSALLGNGISEPGAAQLECGASRL